MQCTQGVFPGRGCAVSGPRCPPGLGPAGKKLWKALTADFAFQAGELVVLEAAARQADDIATLETGLRDGFTVAGSKGQPRLSAAVTEVRQGRLALARLLAELRLPSEGEHAGKNPVKARAADTRWTGPRRTTAGLGRGDGA